MSKRGGFTKFLAGAALGAGLGVLFAPQSGEKNREELKKKFDELIKKLQDVDTEEVKDNVSNKIAEIQKELKDLDKEKVMSLAKEQARHIKSKCDDLVKYAKAKGTPALEDAAASVKEKAVEVLKITLEKLENTENSKKTKKNAK